jgi:transcriptional regulator PpsR
MAHVGNDPVSELLALLEAGSDLAVLLEPEGIAKAVRVPSSGLEEAGLVLAPGVRLADAVAPDSRQKVARLLSGALSSPSGDGEAPADKPREINLLAGGGTAMRPVRATVRSYLGHLFLSARDLESEAVAHQRMLDATQAAAREAAHARAEARRYRQMFEAAREPLLVVDLAARRVGEFNRAAGLALGTDVRGQPFARLFHPSSIDAAQALLTHGEGAVATGLLLASGEPRMDASLSLLREGRRMIGLVSLVPSGTPRADPDVTLWADAARDAPEALVIADPSFSILATNAALLDLIQAPDPAALRGRPLSGLIGRSGVEAQVLLANLREHGTIGGFASVARTALGGLTEVEIHAGGLGRQGQGWVLSLRPLLASRTSDAAVARGQAAVATGPAGTAASGVVDLIGRLPLRDIVRNSSDVIEQMCIEAALGLTGGNRANAADMLGLSRQSLYTKLHRYGLFEPGDEDTP